VVRSHDDGDHLSELAGPWGPVLVRRMSRELSEEVRLRILARDVSLALDIEPDSTLLNQFLVRIRSLDEFRDGEVLVRLGVDDGPDLLARVTKRSVDRLGLRVGTRVYARIKSVALLG
jgi:molybdate transport system ATP-binding protein